MKTTYFMVEGSNKVFSTLKAIRLWLYSLDMQERLEYDTCKIYYCYIFVRDSYPTRVIHIHPITGELRFSKAV